MKDLGITKGEWHACCNKEGEKSHYVYSGEGEVTVCAMLSNDPYDKKEFSDMEGILKISERQANAKLIQDAGNTTNRCGLLPSELLDRVNKLQAFKDYTHKRLDEAGIEKEPNGEHSEHGCRIGDRLDIALQPTIITDNSKVNSELLDRYNEAVEALGEIVFELEDCAQPSDWESYDKLKQVINKHKEG